MYYRNNVVLVQFDSFNHVCNNKNQPKITTKRVNPKQATIQYKTEKKTIFLLLMQATQGRDLRLP